MSRSSRISFVLPLLVLALALAWPGAAAVAAAPAAPPASAAVIDSCSNRAREQARTADVERVVSGTHLLRGCVADAAGIAHLFLEWEPTDGSSSGRICIDPEVLRDTWRCHWDTSILDPGAYVVTMTAVDLAGNVDSFRQAYRVERESGAVTRSDPPPAAQPAPSQDSPAPAAAPPEGDPRSAEPTPERQQPPLDGLELPAGVAPPVTPPLAQFIADLLDRCARLELAPDVAADRALSVAVLGCMRPALIAAGATELTLDEIPVPPAIRLGFPDAVTLAAASELLPEAIGGVGLQLTLVDAVPDGTPGTDIGSN